MSERKLRRQRVIFYVSRSLENVPKAFQTAAARREYYNTLLDQLETEFEHIHRLLLEIFGSGGARVLPMSDLDHFRHYKRFLNPSLNDRFDFDPADGLASELSIQENCWHSEGNGQSDAGFFLDGHYHSLIVLTRWPRTTYPGIIQRLTNLRLLDYTITVNVVSGNLQIVDSAGATAGSAAGSASRVTKPSANGSPPTSAIASWRPRDQRCSSTRKGRPSLSP